MPFVSNAQRKWMYANEPEMAKRWQKHTPQGKKLPEHVGKKAEDEDRISNFIHNKLDAAIKGGIGELPSKSPKSMLRAALLHGIGAGKIHSLYEKAKTTMAQKEKKAFWTGFCEKCAERGVSPFALLQKAKQ